MMTQIDALDVYRIEFLVGATVRARSKAEAIAKARKIIPRDHGPEVIRAIDAQDDIPLVITAV